MLIICMINDIIHTIKINYCLTYQEKNYERDDYKRRLSDVTVYFVPKNAGERGLAYF